MAVCGRGAGRRRGRGASGRAAGPPSPGAASGTPRPIRPTRGTCGCCWPRAGCRSAGSRPVTSWNAGRCWRPTTTCGRAHGLGAADPRGAVPPGRPGPGRGDAAHRAGRGRAAGGRGRCLSPAGQLQVATALEVLEALEARLHAVRHELLDAARHLAGAEGAGRAAVRGRAGRRAGDDLLAGRGRPVLLLPQGGPVRRAGCHRVLLRPQGPAREAVRQGPPALRWALYQEPGKTHARASAPDHRYYAAVKDRCGGKRAALSEAGKILRQACPHPGRARRRRGARPRRLRPLAPSHGD